MKTRRVGEDIGEIWVVVADVLVGFVVVMIVIALRPKPVASTPTAKHTSTPKPTSTPRGGFKQPPAAVSAFYNELKDLQKHQHFEIPELEYAEVHIVFQSDLLFQKCHWTLSDDGRNSLREQACLLWKFDRSIQRIEIEGYSDPKPAETCPTMRALSDLSLPADNVLLSAFRAIAVRNELAKMSTAKCDGKSEIETLGPPDDERVAKLEAVAQGALHPVNSSNPDDKRNRRIEITVHFIEHGKQGE